MVMSLKADATSVSLELSSTEEDAKEAVDPIKFILLLEVSVSVLTDMRE